MERKPESESESDSDMEEEEEEAGEKQPGCFSKYGKTVLRYMFSHVGLCFVLAAYCVLGALLFMATEKDIEAQLANDTELAHRRVRDKMEDTRGYLKNLHNHTQANVTDFANIINAFGREFDEIVNEGLYQGHASEYQAQWSFPSAILYSVSIITAIGYGHINVVTELGQSLVMPYAILGIPLLLMFLTNIGEVLAKSIRFVYAKVTCYERRMRKKIEKAAAKGIVLEDIYDVPQVAVERIKQKTGIRGRETEKIKIHVPVWLTCLVLFSYFLLGALIFSLWEGWTVISSIYFCMISFTTSGLGDLVPGWTTVESLEGKFKLAVTSLYIVIGLSLLAMGFNLIIDETLAYSKKLAKRIGFHKDKDDDEKGKVKSNLDKFVKRKVAKI